MESGRVTPVQLGPPIQRQLWGTFSGRCLKMFLQGWYTHRYTQIHNFRTLSYNLQLRTFTLLGTNISETQGTCLVKMIFPFPRWDQWDMLVPGRTIISQHWKIQVGEIDPPSDQHVLVVLEVAQRPLIVCKNWPGFVPGKVWYAVCHYRVDNWKQCRWCNSKQGSSNGSLAGDKPW